MGHPRLVLLSCIVAACGGSQPGGSQPGAAQRAPTTEDERKLQAIDADYRDYVETSALPRHLQGDGGAAAIRDKSSTLQELLGRYESLADSSDPVAATRAHFGAARALLNFGCEIATLEPPPALPSEARKAYRQELGARASDLLNKSREWASVGAQVGGGVWSDRSAEVAGALADGSDPASACDQLASVWRSPSRPAAAEAPQPSKRECLESVHRPKEACRGHLQQACSTKEGDGCYGLGRLLVADGELKQAQQAFETACKAGHGSACLADNAIALPEMLEAYQQQCTAGEPVGCLRAGRVLDADDPSFTECNAESNLADDGAEAAKRCAAGDAASCWSRAAALVAHEEIDFGGTAGGALFGTGGLGMRGASNAMEAREQLQSKCEGGSAYACWSAASLAEKAGDDPLPWLRKACEPHFPIGCRALTDHLLESGDDAAVGEAVELLVTGCSRGDSTACQRAAKLFHEGSLVPRSKTCAAALSWQGCKPDTPWGCSEINRLFHPSSSQ